MADAAPRPGTPAQDTPDDGQDERDEPREGGHILRGGFLKGQR